MGEDNKNEKERNLNFDDLINDLNSLLDKIPDMVGGTNPKSVNSQSNKDEKQLDESLTNQIQSSKENNTSNNMNIEDLIINPEYNKFDESPQETSFDKEEKLSHNQDIDIVLPEKNDEDLGLELDNIEIEEENIDKIELNEANISSKDDIVVEKEIDMRNEVGEKKDTFDVKSSDTIEIKDIEIEPTVTKVIKGENVSNVFIAISDEAKSILKLQESPTIPPERTRRIGIIYASMDETLLINFLKKLDEISTISSEKPMFVERAFFMIYDENFSTETLLVNCQNEKVNAVVLIGELPVDKMYEIENSVSQIGCSFLTIKMGNFSSSLIIDFILDLISS